MFALSLPSSNNNDTNFWNRIINYLFDKIPFPAAIPILVIYIICKFIPVILKNTSDLNKDLVICVLIYLSIIMALCVGFLFFYIRYYVNNTQSKEISREVEKKSSKINKENKIISDKIRDELESNGGEKESEDENQG